MTESESLSHEELKLALDGNSVDWFLQKLVSVANTGPLEFGVTLFTEGLIISGLLVSGKKYFSTFAKEFSDAYPGDEDSKANIKAAFESNGEIYDHEPDADVPPPQFIHLINARCFSHNGQPLPNNRGCVAWKNQCSLRLQPRAAGCGAGLTVRSSRTRFAGRLNSSVRRHGQYESGQSSGHPPLDSRVRH